MPAPSFCARPSNRDEGHRLLGEAVDAWLEEQGF
jgi:hypothetical protein